MTNYPRKAKKMPAKSARNIVLVVERDVDAVEYLLWQRPATGEVHYRPSVTHARTDRPIEANHFYPRHHPSSLFSAPAVRTGLLASLWEFPSFPAAAAAADESSELQNALDHCKALLRTSVESGRAIERFRYVAADVFHQFSHISQTYAVYRAAAVGPCEATSLLPQLPAQYQAFRWMSREQIADTAISTAMKKVFEHALAQNNEQQQSRRRGAKRKETDRGGGDDDSPEIKAPPRERSRRPARQ